MRVPMNRDVRWSPNKNPMNFRWMSLNKQRDSFFVLFFVCFFNVNPSLLKVYLGSP